MRKRIAAMPKGRLLLDAILSVWWLATVAGTIWG